MTREQFDELYHLLRVASNEAAESKDQELSSTIIGITKHLLEGGDYLRLIQYSAYYGRNFLLEPTYLAMKEAGWEPTRIVEFGAGLGWLGHGLANKFGLLPNLFVDKRHWVLIDIVADLETEQGLKTVSAALRPGDFIVMSDFLHCIEEPEQLLQRFVDYPIAVLEYGTEGRLYENSFNVQLERYGVKPIPYGMLKGMLLSARTNVQLSGIGPYTLALLHKEEQ